MRLKTCIINGDLKYPTFSHLPNRFNMFTPKNYAIYVLDVHLLPEEIEKGYWNAATCMLVLVEVLLETYG